MITCLLHRFCSFKETYLLSKDGYIILEQVFSHELISTANALVDELFKEDFTENNKKAFSNYFLPDRKDQGVLYDLYFRFPIFRKFTESDIILTELTKVLGESIMLYENSLVSKAPGTKNEVPWHQDFMNRTKEPKKYIVWIALDKITKENGALKVIPGSHLNGFLDFYRVDGETHHTRLDTRNIDINAYEYVELNQGDVLIFDQLLVHGSDRAEGKAPRRAYRFACQSLEMLYTPRCTPVILKGGTPRTCPKEMNLNITDERTLNQNSSEVKKTTPTLKRRIKKILLYFIPRSSKKSN